MRNQLLILAVGAALTALFAAGCGDDSEAAVTKQSFVKQADAICVQQKQKLKANESRNIEAGNFNQMAKENIAAVGIEVRRIEQLGIPSDRAGMIEEILSKVRRALKLSEGSGAKLDAANKSLIEAEELADDYGLEQCFLAY